MITVLSIYRREERRKGSTPQDILQDVKPEEGSREPGIKTMKHLFRVLTRLRRKRVIDYKSRMARATMTVSLLPTREWKVGWVPMPGDIEFKHGARKGREGR